MLHGMNFLSLNAALLSCGSLALSLHALLSNSIINSQVCLEVTQLISHCAF